MSTIIRNLFITFVSVLVIGFGCKTVEDTSSQDSTGQLKTDTTETLQESSSSSLAMMLNNTRSSLRDVYLTQKHDMPKIFLNKDSVNQAVRSDPYAGYRVQILSTRDMQRADSVAGSYRIWSDTTLAGYQAPAYLTYRQPYYRVQIGDFHERSRANYFSQLIKDKFPDAWVVHQRINPKEVPADTIEFGFQKQKPDSLKADTVLKR